ncbi:MAG: hypothetical protein OEM91_11270 [Hyphomicrobiales bacterium]|nr:hypothetical protein [Hyphomicrobiales bacterium]
MVQDILCFVMEIVGYTTARLLLPLVSFGTVRVETLGEEASGYNWLGLRREASGTWLLDATAAGWVGLFFWIGISIAVIAVLR